MVANPANTNALILKEFAPSIPEKNITCLTRLDHNRALGQISERLNVPVSTVKNVIIWGNHSSSQYPDVNHAVVGGKPVREAVADDAWYTFGTLDKLIFALYLSDTGFQHNHISFLYQPLDCSSFSYYNQLVYMLNHLMSLIS